MKATLKLLLPIALLFAATAQAGCPLGRTATILENQYGAVNRESFVDMVQALHADDTERLQALLEAGAIIRLPPGRHACILQRPYHTTRLRIRFSGDDGRYWVLSSSLARQS